MGLSWEEAFGGGITIFTGMEVGYIAIGVGAAAGLGAKLFAKGVSMPLGVIAAVFGILGVFIGKYAYVAHDLSTLGEQIRTSPEMQQVPTALTEAVLAEAKLDFKNEYGVEMSEINIFSVGVILKFMFDPEMEIFAGLDIVFVLFALVAAWKFASR